MKTTGSVFSRWLCVGAALRARCRAAWMIAVAALGLMVAAPAPGHAQAPPLGTAANFTVLAGTGITNTGATVLLGTPLHPGDIGSSTAAITGFPPGIVVPPGIIHAIGDGPTLVAQNSVTTAYNNLAGRPATVNLTGQDLGGLVLVPGVYSFSSSAQLTGALTLNGLGNPNSIFVFNINSTLTTASNSTVSLVNGAQGGNVFWRVGSSATLGTNTAFTGDILALTSITLNTGATITCGAAWAQNGAVTLDNNTISICELITGGGGGGGGVIIGPTGFPLFVSLLPSTATENQRSVAEGLDAFVSAGGVLPLTFLNLFNLSPTDLAIALTQLSGEAGTGIAQAGTQAMNSFLSLLTSPFGDERGVAPPPRPPLITKAPVYKAQAGPAPDPRSWGIWGAGYGSQGNAAGDPFGIGSHDRSIRTYGYASGFDYRVTPYTVAGLALAGGGTRYGLADGLGGGRSDMFQAAVYAVTRFDAAYVSAAVAYAWHRVSTDRYLTVAGTDHLTADFNANNIGGRIEGGYRFALPWMLGWPGWPGSPGRAGVTPYAAAQMQSFRTPSYTEGAVSGSSIFALAYEARTTNTTRTELGARFDWSMPVDYGATLTLRGRAAWAHDHWSEPTVTAMFVALPGSSFVVIGAAPAGDLLLASGGAELWFSNGFSFAAWFDGEFAEHAQKYAGTGRLRYVW